MTQATKTRANLHGGPRSHDRDMRDDEERRHPARFSHARFFTPRLRRRSYRRHLSNATYPYLLWFLRTSSHVYLSGRVPKAVVLAHCPALELLHGLFYTACSSICSKVAVERRRNHNQGWQEEKGEAGKPGRVLGGPASRPAGPPARSLSAGLSPSVAPGPASSASAPPPASSTWGPRRQADGQSTTLAQPVS